jgi:hypothetical protein
LAEQAASKLTYYQFPEEHWGGIRTADEIDKLFCAAPGIFGFARTTASQRAASKDGNPAAQRFCRSSFAASVRPLLCAGAPGAFAAAHAASTSIARA